MADRDTIVFLATLADTPADFSTLATILIPILKSQQGAPRPSVTSLSWSVIPQVGISIRDAYFADSELVDAKNAIGRISADLIAPYPPGVAVVAPGEVLTAEIVTGLSVTQAAGVRIAYATDPTLKKYRVIYRHAN
jgi:lysine decarboxylase